MNIALGQMSSDLRSLAEEWPLVFQFKLPPKATIVVAGCYEGRVMDLLGHVYPDFRRMVGFDLQSEACAVAAKKFIYDNRIETYKVGLGAVTTKMRPGRYGSVDTTLMTTDPLSPLCDIREIREAFGNARLDRGVDLLVLNMEGYEYDLIAHMAEQLWALDIDRIVVQFHPLYLSEKKIHTSALRLETGYRLVVDELPQWGYWRRPSLDKASS